MTVVVLDYNKSGVLTSIQFDGAEVNLIPKDSVGEVRVYTDLEIEMNEVENWLNEHDPGFKESQCNWMCSKDQIPISWMNDKGEYIKTTMLFSISS